LFYAEKRSGRQNEGNDRMTVNDARKKDGRRDGGGLEKREIFLFFRIALPLHAMLVMLPTYYLLSTPVTLVH
jgi:hypothetical protein